MSASFILLVFLQVQNLHIRGGFFSMHDYNMHRIDANICTPEVCAYEVCIAG